MSIALPSLKVETRTRASSVSLLLAAAVLALGLAAPFLVSRGAVQDLFQVEQPDYSGFERSLGCRVDSTQLTLTGLCRDCLEASQAKSS